MGDAVKALALGILLATLPARAQEDSAAADTGAVATGEDPEAVAEGAGEEAAEPVPPLFMEAYTEGAYSEHEEDNASGFADVKLGKRFGAAFPVDVYLKARMHRDQRDFFWNNHIDAGAGARVSLLKGAALSLYAEWLGGFYYRTEAQVLGLASVQSRLDRTRGALDAVQERFGSTTLQIFRRAVLGDTVFSQKALDSLDRALTAQGTSLSALDAYLDSVETVRDSLRERGDSLALIPAGPLREFRAGFLFWYGRGQDPVPGGAGGTFPLRFWCDLYADGTFSSLRRHVRTRKGGEDYVDSVAAFDNLILYANPDAGLILFDGPGGSLTAYGTLYAWFDTHGDWWNNRAMAGPGLRHKPLRDFDLVLAFEYLWGAYYGREREDDPNPYDRTFQDIRLTASFWYGLGL